MNQGSPLILAGVLIGFIAIVVPIMYFGTSSHPEVASPPEPPMPALGQRGVLRATPGWTVPLALDPTYLIPIGSDGKFLTPDLLSKYADKIQAVPNQTPVQVVAQHWDSPRCVEVKIAGGDYCGTVGFAYPEWVH